MKPTDSGTVPVNQPSLPKGGGAIKGMGEALGNVGMTGMAGLSVPLPISAGRGNAPSLALSYSSGGGNSTFGIGWDVSLMSIRRRTSAGAPLYVDDDVFLGPDGEMLVPEIAKDQQVVVETVTQYAGLVLDQAYRVVRFFSCIEGAFSRIERWSPTENATGDFWLIQAADGQLFCLGKTPQSRIADPVAPDTRIGVWLLEESVTLTGEHISYQYRRENADGVVLDAAETARAHTANRYLTQVAYGNVTGYAPLYAWQQYAPADAPQWHFTLVFDYGERPLDPLIAPPWLAAQPWPCRADAFSDYALGFEVRTHRLCRQVLMFHHFPDELGQAQSLVTRLLLKHTQSPRMSQLASAQIFAYEHDGRVQSMPRLDFSYTVFATALNPAKYAVMPSLPALSDGTRYQMVDLYGEGLPGILYRVGSDWRYQAPVRGTNGPDAVDYSAWRPLPEVPSPQPKDGGQRALMDLTGDGRLDWVVTHRSLPGYFTLNPDRSWSNFVPFPALPVEFLHPTGQLADLVGAGLPDLALIGPKSVRLYPNLRERGFGQGMEVPHVEDDDLPMAAGDATTLVAFSDVLGSGQQHLVRITHDRVMCWPNLGRGRFGQPLRLATLPFDSRSFNPARIFLADLDGSGAADLIYAESSHFLIFMNQSGNGFGSLPYALPMPAGARYDQLAQVNFADVDGCGTTSLVLSIPHMAPKHWRYNFAVVKPYLLNTLNNNMGAHTQLTYRSSAQEWLDEKQARPESVSELPFAIQLVSTVSSLDEINGNRLAQKYLYRRGVYAGLEREFRGFGFVQHLDTLESALPTTPDAPTSAPTLTKVWYSTGQEDDARRPGALPYVDPDLFPLAPLQLSSFNGIDLRDEPFVTDSQETRHQVQRALKGSVLRQEMYGQDDSPRRDIPYSVQTARFLLRLLQPMRPADRESRCVVRPIALEQLSVVYERIAADPVVQQQVNLRVDAYGTPVWSVAIHYPRRPKAATNPYTDCVSDQIWASSYDEEQMPLRFMESRIGVFNLTSRGGWRLALPSRQRQDVLTYERDHEGLLPTEHRLSQEDLLSSRGLLDSARPRTFAGQAVTFYFDAAGVEALPAGEAPPPLALVHHVETAELDDQALVAYADIPASELEEVLTRAGYLKRGKILGEIDDATSTLWVIPSGYATYVDQDKLWLPFERPRSMQSSPISAPRQLTYDANTCVVETVTDGLGNRISAQYDYRFLAPCRITDPNENTQEVLFDALGRVVASSAYGVERGDSGNAVKKGFAPLTEFNPKAAALANIDAALAGPASAIQQAAAVYLYDMHSWTRAARSPVQTAVLTADQYPGTVDPAPQIQIAMSYSDGFGRPLQSKQLCPPGLAYVVTPDGTLELHDGKPVERVTGASPRWAVSGRVEYDNKGQVIRVYQPYFIDRAAYVNDEQTRVWGYADTHYYDPVGREVAVVTALGYLRRAGYYAWFSTAEDENDTLSEVMARR